MNHKLIMGLLEIYNQLPEATPDMAARRLAVLIEGELEEMEKNGVMISRESLCEHLKETLKKYPKQKAS